MSDRPATPAKSSTAIIAAVLIVVFLVVPMLYVLSIGPAAWLADKGYINGDNNSPAHRFYSPLIWLRDNVQAVENVMGAYLKLFVGEPPLLPPSLPPPP